jgi:hypothetical protein
MAKLKYGFDERSLRWWLSTHEDIIFARNGAGHVLPEYRTIYKTVPNAKILAIAHLDTVQKLRGMTASERGKKIHACGLDDRLGAYIVHEWLHRNGIAADILLTDMEESGASTASCFAGADDYNWVVEFDRAGEDVVTYGLDCPEWLNALRESGFKTASGAYSDIVFLKTERCCVNIGVGYELAHSADSFADLSVLDRQLKRFKNFYAKHKNTRFTIAKSSVKSFGCAGGGNWPDEWRNLETGSSLNAPAPAKPGEWEMYECAWCSCRCDGKYLDEYGMEICASCAEMMRRDSGYSNVASRGSALCDGCGAVSCHVTNVGGVGMLCDDCVIYFQDEIEDSEFETKGHCS